MIPVGYYVQLSGIFANKNRLYYRNLFLMQIIVARHSLQVLVDLYTTATSTTNPPKLLKISGKQGIDKLHSLRTDLLPRH
jgi:hypothetical protein